MPHSLWRHGGRDELVRLPPIFGFCIANKQCPVILDTGLGELVSTMSVAAFNDLPRDARE